MLPKTGFPLAKYPVAAAVLLMPLLLAVACGGDDGEPSAPPTTDTGAETRAETQAATEEPTAQAFEVPPTPEPTATPEATEEPTVSAQDLGGDSDGGADTGASDTGSHRGPGGDGERESRGRHLGAPDHARGAGSLTGLSCGCGWTGIRTEERTDATITAG